MLCSQDLTLFWIAMFVVVLMPVLLAMWLIAKFPVSEEEDDA